MSWDTLEEAFEELDRDEYSVFSKSLWTYFCALVSKGFSRKEAFRLLEGYAKFLYDMSFETFMQTPEEEDEPDAEDDEEAV